MVGGPAREQAYQQLAALLDRGVYPPGARLPGERALADQIKVSRSTLRLALLQLAEDGRLVPSAQRGWFVPQLVLGEPPSQLVSFTELAAQRGLRATSRVLSRQTRPATFEEAADLQVAAAAPLIEVVRLRGMDGVPITVESAVLPLRRVAWLADEDLTDRSLYGALEEHDIRVHRSTYTVQAMNAGELGGGAARPAHRCRRAGCPGCHLHPRPDPDHHHRQPLPRRRVPVHRRPVPQRGLSPEALDREVLTGMSTQRIRSAAPTGRQTRPQQRSVRAQLGHDQLRRRARPRSHWRSRARRAAVSAQPRPPRRARSGPGPAAAPPPPRPRRAPDRRWPRWPGRWSRGCSAAASRARASRPASAGGRAPADGHPGARGEPLQVEPERSGELAQRDGPAPRPGPDPPAPPAGPTTDRSPRRRRPPSPRPEPPPVAARPATRTGRPTPPSRCPGEHGRQPVARAARSRPAPPRLVSRSPSTYSQQPTPTAVTPTPSRSAHS